MADIVYSKTELAPQLDMFDCAEFDCRLSTKGCSARWRAAQEPEPPSSDVQAQRKWDSLLPCRGCPIGALHAGGVAVNYSAFFGAGICPRCRRGAVRFIQGRVCVSCYNRSREMAIGRNARGNSPRMLQRRPLHSIDLTVMIDGRGGRARYDGVIDVLEVLMTVRRTVRGRAQFSFAGAMQGLKQPRLL